MLVDVAVAWRREEAPIAPPGGWAVVIDVLRATSSITTALAAGAVRVRPVAEIEAAFAAAAEHPEAVLAGERSCRMIPGFQLGNSPASFLSQAVLGREVVLATTNGSRALFAAGSAGFAEVLALSLLNLGAVAAAVCSGAPASLTIICAGTNGCFSLDDAFVAGALVDRLQSSVHVDGDDAAISAAMLYRCQQHRPLDLFLGCRAGRNLIEAGMRGDVEFCARTDAFFVVPTLRDGVMVARPYPDGSAGATPSAAD